jgi:hypothetical protein
MSKHIGLTGVPRGAEKKLRPPPREGPVRDGEPRGAMRSAGYSECP